MENYDVIIIGGGGTGGATAYDLALRGLKVALFERGELTSGTTGRHHGQLHSGARYALGDVRIARECMDETLILRRIAVDCIEYNQGLFLAITEEEAELADEFISACRAATIPAEEIPVKEALRMEGRINPQSRRTVRVPDGTIDAYRLAMAFFASARKHGADIRTFSEVTAIERSGDEVSSVRVRDIRDGREYSAVARAVINTGGPWSGKIGALAGIDSPVTPAAGTMVAVEGRLTNMVISRLRRPGDGDIIVPQRRLSIIGTTQHQVENPDGLLSSKGDAELLLSAADDLIPGFSKMPVFAKWCAARPLAGRIEGNSRAISRDIAVYDHGERDGIRGFFSILGGKATTLRIMGEMAGDAVAAYLGISEKSQTSETGLVPYQEYWRTV